MKSGDQAAQASNWRQRLRNMRTLVGLRAAKPDHGALAALDADALAAAAANPDHSEAGRAAAVQAMHERGFAAGAWRLSVPGFITAADLARGERLFFGWGRAVRVWCGKGIFLILVGLLALAFFVESGAGGDANVDIELPDMAAGLIGLATLSLVMSWFIASALRRRPARVLLLRKFNRREFSAPLERLMARELRPYGHIVSLSDRHIKRDTFGWVSMAMLSLSNPLAMTWFVIGAPVRFFVRLFDRSSMGPAVVLNARDYRNFARRLHDRIGLNIQVAMTSKEAVLVRTSDSWWKLVVRLLLDSADAIIVDVSNVTAGTAWELELIREEGAAARCVFVSLWGKAEEARAALARLDFPNACFHYAPDGEMQRRAQFRAALMDAMSATHAA